MATIRTMTSMLETRRDGTMFISTSSGKKEVFFRPKENGYKEIKLKDGRIISGHLNSHGEIILREVPNQSLGRGSRITTGQHNTVFGYKSGFSGGGGYHNLSFGYSSYDDDAFTKDLIVTEDDIDKRRESNEEHYSLKPKTKDDIQIHIEKILKSTCSNRGISFLSISDKLISGGSLMKWSPMEVIYDMNDPINPKSLINEIIKVVNKYTPRVDSLSWEKQGDDKFVLYAKLI